MKACGQKATVARAPYGAADQREFDLAQKPFFMWSLDTLDWKTLNVESTVDAVMNGDLTDGSIILMHDTMSLLYRLLFRSFLSWWKKVIS